MPEIIDIEGGVNFRDFGGYPTVAGGCVVEGNLFRCGTLSNVTPTGLATFNELDIRHICDLRRADERADDPTPLPPENPRRTVVSIDPGSAPSMRQVLRSRPPTEDQRMNFMMAINEDLVRGHTKNYHKVFATLLDTRDGGFWSTAQQGRIERVSQLR
jgi:protein-tyrosine phosphatase